MNKLCENCGKREHCEWVLKNTCDCKLLEENENHIPRID